jgi:putative endonuclease
MTQGYIYILTNKKDGVLYIGVTSNIIRRIYEHKNGLVDGFSKKYNCKILVYIEIYNDISDAITREKVLKGWVRSKKIDLINSQNSDWLDLYQTIL